ncbi:MAG: vWA domain-containing protein [Gaiellales bacterium]
MTLLPPPPTGMREPRAIPHVDSGTLAPCARPFRRRLGVACVLALAAALLLVLLPARGTSVPGALAGGDGVMIVIDVSSSTLGFSDTIGKALLVLARNPEQKAGLVLASESAYMALPPDTPGSALRGWQRMITYVNEQNQKLAARAKLDRTPLPNPAPGDYPWVGIFTGGTKLSAGLAKAIQGLRESGRKGGQIVLISDLRDPPEDLPKVSALISRMRELGLTLRIVTVGDASRDPAFFSDFGGAKFITGAATTALATDHLEVPSPYPSPWPLVGAGVALALLLGFVELRQPLRFGRQEP